jgi:hypothetical protein
MKTEAGVIVVGMDLADLRTALGGLKTFIIKRCRHVDSICQCKIHKRKIRHYSTSTS